ncbi:HAD family hydrolase [Candidatus Woesebacteria bacterium]|nr:HAD family hydrolase [Candidatus Woesebacteria bacterium]
MIKAVVFDLDDTLLQTRETKFAAIKYAGEHFYSQSISDATINSHWGKPFREFTSLVFGDVDSVDGIISNYKSIVQQFKNREHPGTRETLELLFPHYKVCILSSAAQSLVLYDLETAGLPIQKFTFIQAAEDTSVHKPDPKVFIPTLTVLKESGIEPVNILYVGDIVSDYLAASGAGVHFRGIAERTISADEFKKAGASTILSIRELPKLLSQWPE